jgi:hypothetical protein
MAAPEEGADFALQPSHRDSTTKLLLCTGRLQPPPLHRPPNHIATAVLPETLEPPYEMHLPVGKMLKKTVTDETRYVLPLVVSQICQFLLQDGTNRNNGSKRVSKKQKLEKELPAQYT